MTKPMADMKMSKTEESVWELNTLASDNTCKWAKWMC